MKRTDQQRALAALERAAKALNRLPEFIDGYEDDFLNRATAAVQQAIQHFEGQPQQER